MDFDELTQVSNYRLTAVKKPQMQLCLFVKSFPSPQAK
jgi:hypothetical protein